ncbi:hypothetical protein [Terricaulis silvestris]|uniref:hypothetical protein n=1 Tax=Terricaulis silvestris TaxID=2686094 RepID=UPI00131D69EE|nr:hypothetical protein [Terricaulis silvestris]
MSLLWYGAGTYTIQMAQLGRLPHLSPDEVAYYAAKPVWLIAITAISTYGSALASALLLMRSRPAVWLFAIALVFILLNNGIELANGTSRAFANTGATIATVVIVLLAFAVLLYAHLMRKRGVLR